MTTLRDTNRKIQSIGNIQKITQTMEFVAASHLRKAQMKAESASLYASKLQEMLDCLIPATKDIPHPLLFPRLIKKIGIVLIASDRGLCGGYNQNIFNAAEKFLQKYQTDQVTLIPVGRKPNDYFANKKWRLSFKIKEWGGKITYPQIEELTKNLIDFYLKEQLDEIYLIYTHFINLSTREIRIEKFLPIEVKNMPYQNYLFEPDPFTILEEMLSRYFTMKLASALNEAYISELAARIASMRSATKNAEELLEKLSLTRNKVRQSGITKEIIEIISGAESLRG